MVDMQNGWTLGTLNTHLSSKLGELRDQTQERFLASEKAVQAALEAADKAVAAALQAQKEAAQKAERSAEARHTELVQRLNQTADILTEKITSLALRYESTQGASSGVDKAWSFGVAAIGIVVAIVSVATR